MADRLARQAARFLGACGYSEDRILEFSDETRLLHDVRLLGDTALEQLQILQREFQVDMSKFSFKKYFPDEYGLDAFILTALWRSKWSENIRKKYPPITLGMLNEVIDHRRWIFD